MSARTINFGWAREPFAEQLPDLPPTKAAEFDADATAILRLHMRGFITDSQRDQVICKVTREISRVLAPPTPEAA